MVYQCDGTIAIDTVLLLLTWALPTSGHYCSPGHYLPVVIIAHLGITYQWSLLLTWALPTIIIAHLGNYLPVVIIAHLGVTYQWSLLLTWALPTSGHYCSPGRYLPVVIIAHLGITYQWSLLLTWALPTSGHYCSPWALPTSAHQLELCSPETQSSHGTCCNCAR